MDNNSSFICKYLICIILLLPFSDNFIPSNIVHKNSPFWRGAGKIRTRLKRRARAGRRLDAGSCGQRCGAGAGETGPGRRTQGPAVSDGGRGEISSPPGVTGRRGAVNAGARGGDSGPGRWTQVRAVSDGVRGGISSPPGMPGWARRRGAAVSRRGSRRQCRVRR